MNVFTLTAAGLVALGLPLAAPWLAQDANTAPAASVQVLNLRDAFASTTVAPAPTTTIIRSPIAAAAAQDTRAPALNRAVAPEATLRARTTEPAPQDEAARQIAELQARIATLQAEVAALSARTGRKTATGALLDAEHARLLEAQSRNALESALVDQRDTLAEVEALVEHGMLSRAQAAERRAAAEARVAQALSLGRAAQEHREADRQMEGERLRSEREAQRERSDAQRERGEALRERQRAELEMQRDLLQEHAERYEVAAEEHEAALEELEARMEDEELSERDLQTLEAQRAELERRVERFLAQARTQQDMYADFEARLDNIDWADFAIEEEFEGLDYVDTQELADLGYLGYISDEECEECETDKVAVDTWLEEMEAEAYTYGTRKRREAPAVDARASGDPAWFEPAPPAPRDNRVAPRSSNGDVIVNVGGGSGGNDAEIVDLLREIRDEVRALRADLRSLHGATPPQPTPRASRRGDFGFAPNSTPGPIGGPGVASGFDSFAPSGPFDAGSSSAVPLMDGIPTIGSLFGSANSGSFPSGGDAFAPSTTGGGGFSGAGYAPSFDSAPAAGAPTNPFAPNSFPSTGAAGVAPTGTSSSSTGSGSLR